MNVGRNICFLYQPFDMNSIRNFRAPADRRTRKQRGGTGKAPPASGSFFFSDHLHVLRLRAPVRCLDLELDPLPLLQTPESSGLDCRVMDKEITAPVLLNEAKSFLLVEPLDDSL